MFPRFLCLVGRHDFAVIHRISGMVQHIGCCRCKQEFVINHEVQAVLPWDDDFKAFYATEVVPGVPIYVPDPDNVARRLDRSNYTRKVPA